MLRFAVGSPSFQQPKKNSGQAKETHQKRESGNQRNSGLQAAEQVDDHRVQFKRSERRNQEVVIKTGAQANQGKIKQQIAEQSQRSKAAFWG